MAYNYRKINYEVMSDTKNKYQTTPELQDAIKKSIQQQFMIAEEDNIDQPATECHTAFVVSGKRSFEAAKDYQGKKIAVLNFANNHSIGGAPFSAGAQEESLCRCSTLLPCLEAMRSDFYDRHIHLYEKGLIGNMGNDDLIYTPNIVVFKTDERKDPIYPTLMKKEEWYKVNVITSAAPELNRMKAHPKNYEEIITKRIKKILDIAWREKNEILILGAWGCGAFGNPPDIVAKVFHRLLNNYNFETVEFALSSNNDVSNSVFGKEFCNGTKECYKNKFTNIAPDNIQSLEPNEVFVFGSNLQGQHGGGAAKLAYEKFGAVWGLGVGLAGQTYAIPTMHGDINAIKPYVDQFIETARIMQDKKFLVTKIGCGIAGFSVSQIAPLFKNALELDNVALPKDFVEYLKN